MEKDISQISKFGFTAWEFLSAIYKVDHQQESKSFRQCVSSQFNKTLSKANEYFQNIFLISPRLNKKVMEKLNFID